MNGAPTMIAEAYERTSPESASLLHSTATTPSMPTVPSAATAIETASRHSEPMVNSAFA